LKQVIDANDVARVRQMIGDDPSLLDAPIGYSGAGSLTWAAECRGSATPPSDARLEIARILINAGADPNEHFGSPMLRAVLNDGRIPMMELLVSQGADVNAIWKNYGPILMGPCETLAPESIRWLIAHGADPDFVMGSGQYVSTAMDMVLCTYDRSDRKPGVEALIEGGADFEDGPEMDIHRGD
jgi:ankyrin repeat protein